MVRKPTYKKMVVGLPGRSIHEIGASLPSQKLTFIAPIRKRAPKGNSSGRVHDILTFEFTIKNQPWIYPKINQFPTSIEQPQWVLLVVLNETDKSSLKNSSGLDNPGCFRKDMVGESNIFKNHVYHLYMLDPKYGNLSYFSGFSLTWLEHASSFPFISY